MTQGTQDAYVPYRWAELMSLDAVTTFMELDRLPEYGFTGATIHSSFADHALDSYYYTLPVTYRRFAEFNTVRDRNRVTAGAGFLAECIRRAHRRGLTVMHWHNLCNFVGGPPTSLGNRVNVTLDAVRRIHPDWLNKHGEADFSRQVWYDFMEAEAEDFLSQFPQLDGLFCWNCESSIFTPSRLRHQSVPRSEIVRRAMKVVYDVCRRHGKTMTHDIHSGGADRAHSEHIIAAAAECPELILGADCTYSDWQFFMPTTPWLETMRAHNRIYVGFDSGGEYFGKGEALGPWPGWIIRHFTHAKPFRLTAVTTRTEVFSRGVTAFASPFLDLNLRVLMALARAGCIDLDRELESWWNRQFDGAWSPALKDVVLRFETLIGKILHVNELGFTNLSTAYPENIILPGGKVGFFDQLAEPGTRYDAAACPMLSEAARTVKPFAHLRQEKRDGIALCDDAVAKLAALGLPDDTRGALQRRFLQARDVAVAHLLQLDAAHALFQQIGDYNDGTLADPRAALRGVLVDIRAHADAMEARWGAEFYDEFTGSMRRYADSVPREYLPAETNQGQPARGV